MKISSFMIIGFVTSIILLYGALQYVLSKDPAPIDATLLQQLKYHYQSLFLIFVSLLLFYIGVDAFFQFRKLTSALENFEQFDAEFRKKWHQHIPPLTKSPQ